MVQVVSAPNALLLAGSGMLNGVAAHLAAQGWRVVLPNRRYTPLAVSEPCPGKAVWVRADWGRPRELARDAERALEAPAALLVAWVHETYRNSVLGAVEPLLAGGAPVVEVRAVAELGLTPPEPRLLGRTTQQVLLGTVCEDDTDRALGQDEIIDGVRDAVERALRGRPSSVHQLGKRCVAWGRVAGRG